MQIHFKVSRASAKDDELFSKASDIAQRKIETLKKYLARDIETTQVYVELGKESEAHVSGYIWKANINLDSRGKRYNAGAVAETIEKAVDGAVSELESELRKAKRRSESMLRLSGNSMKLWMRGFRHSSR
jgi:ribosomal subunit interface protein